MHISIWPNADRLTLVRLLILLGILTAAVGGTIQLKRIGNEAGEASLRMGLSVVSGRLFEGISGKAPSNQQNRLESDAIYGWSLTKQLSIAAKAQEFYRDQHKAPATFEDLAKYGLVGADARDPWNRRYRMHVLAGNLFVIQTTGPSGNDAIDWDRAGLRNDLLNKKVRMFGDNLVIAKLLEGEPLSQNK
jgi:hypothetical protein